MNMNTLDCHEGNESTQKLSLIGTVNLLCGVRSTGKYSLMKSLYSQIEPQVEEFFVFTQLSSEKYTELTIKDHIFEDINMIEPLFEYFGKTPKIFYEFQLM